MRPYPPTCDPLTHLPPTHALAWPPQLFSPADVALRLRGRELVAPDEAWAHFYPEPLAEPREDALTGVPMMGVPSVDEFARTRGWLHQKVLGIRGDCTYLLHCTTTVLSRSTPTDLIGHLKSTGACSRSSSSLGSTNACSSCVWHAALCVRHATFWHADEQ